MKISIIGCGKVGSAIAYTLLMKERPDEILLIDIDTKKMEGEALDLIHSLPVLGHYISILKGSYEDVKGSKVIIITAGLPRRPGEDRLDLLKKNAKIIREILSSLPKLDPSTFLFIISNPVDILTYLAIKYSNLPSKNIFGLGTVLDTMRFKVHISEYLNVAPNDVDAFIIGEHGESMVPVWSLVRIGGIPLVEFGQFSEKIKMKVFEATRVAGARLNEAKGGASWAVAMASYKVIKSIFSHKRRVLPVTALVDDYCGIDGVCLSLPTFISVDGIGERLDLPLLEEEKEGLLYSAKVLKEAISKVED